MTQVLQQQQHEREKQLVLQREQLAQQKSQLDQIQSLQNQLQQQLEEQKRQKTAAQSVQVTAVLAYSIWPTLSLMGIYLSVGIQSGKSYSLGGSLYDCDWRLVDF